MPAPRRASPARGYKDWGRCDLTYVELDEGTAVAGVFTRNICCSSEVELGRANVAQGRAALVVNAGNSNAFTGYRGREAVEQIMAQVADHLGCAKEQVFVSSTGVIGVPLPKDKARAGVKPRSPHRNARGRTPPAPSARPTPSPRAPPPPP
jgi:glutamate N-acetyltransferase/amino-acid N-acetyltransferase